MSTIIGKLFMWCISFATPNNGLAKLVSKVCKVVYSNQDMFLV